MRTLIVSALLGAGALFASAASAQEAQAPAPTAASTADFSPIAVYSPPTDSTFNLWEGAISDRYRAEYSVQEGIAALEAGKYAAAETVFEKLLNFPAMSQATGPAVRFYLGVAEMNLGKWEEAKAHLMTAARRLRNLPDPKSRLGVTYARLGDVEGANAQRARLVEMGKACKGTCRNAQYIEEGIRLIDEAMAQPPAVKTGEG